MTLVKQDITNNLLYLVEFVLIYQVVLLVTVQQYLVQLVPLVTINNHLLNVKHVIIYQDVLHVITLQFHVLHVLPVITNKIL